MDDQTAGAWESDQTIELARNCATVEENGLAVCRRDAVSENCEARKQKPEISSNKVTIVQKSSNQPAKETTVDGPHRGETLLQTAATSSAAVELNDVRAEAGSNAIDRATLSMRNDNEIREIVRWRSLRDEDDGLEEQYLNNKRYDIILMFHNEFVGHGGVERTMKLLRRQGNNWERMRHDVRQFIGECPLCQKMNHAKPVINTLPFRLANVVGPMVHLGCDAIGSLPVDVNGYQHILVIQCLFTRWVELMPIRSVDGKTAGKEIIKHICRYGTPMSILSDNGPQFINHMIEELFKVAGIEHVNITAYSHEENGIVERCNKEVGRHLLMLVNERREKDNWADLLPLIQRIYNTSDCCNIGASPADLMFKKLNIDRRITEKPIEGLEGDITLSKWLDGFLGTQEAMINKAKEIQRAANLRNPNRGFKSSEAFEPKPGTYVLLEDPAGKEDKLSLPLSGPYKCEIVEGNKIGLKNLIWNTPRKVHKSTVRPFVYNPRRTDPRKVAIKEKQEFDVEKIMLIVGVDGPKSNIQVKLRWAGLGPQHDSWVPWKAVHQNSIFHKYLKDHKLRRLLPRSAKEHSARLPPEASPTASPIDKQRREVSRK
jgi:hypothetical protein